MDSRAPKTAYCVSAVHPVDEGVAPERIKILDTYLPRAVGRDREARASTFAAASMGATAFQKGLGAIHSIYQLTEAEFVALAAIRGELGG